MRTPIVTDSPRPHIGLVLLAAGASRRLGTPKQLLRDADGLSLIRRAAHTALDSGCRPVVAVLGASAAEIGNELLGLPVMTVMNPDWQNGMASSLRVGLAGVTGETTVEAVIVMLCDQPLVTAALLRSLIDTYRASTSEVVACEYGEALGVPALFGQSLFGSLASLTGDQGARYIIRAHDDLVARLSFPEGRFDVDTFEDTQRLISRTADTDAQTDVRGK